MKIITAKEIRKILRRQWPKLRHIWIFDKKLVVLPDNQVNIILEGIDVYKQQFKNELFDCDDFALVANAFVKIKGSELCLSYSWAFGEASIYYPEKGIHNQNIFITEDFEIRLFEPQKNEITLPDNETVFYVRI